MSKGFDDLVAKAGTGKLKKVSVAVAQDAPVLEAVKAAKGERYTIKQMEKTKKSLHTRLSKLNDATKKDFFMKIVVLT